MRQASTISLSLSLPLQGNYALTHSAAYARYAIILFISMLFITQNLSAQVFDDYKVTKPDGIRVRSSPSWAANNNVIGILAKDEYIKVYSDWKLPEFDTVRLKGVIQNIYTIIWRKIRVGSIDAYICEKDQLITAIEKITGLPKNEPRICGYFLNNNKKKVSTFADFCINKGLTETNEVIDYVVKDIIYLAGSLNNKRHVLISCPNIGDNCLAVISDGNPYILFNSRFLDDLSHNQMKQSPLYAIMSHELGHHFFSHTLKEGEGYNDEIDADYFSGSILKRLGVSATMLDDVLTFFDGFKYEENTTHPTIQKRKEAVRKGWNNASELDKEREITAKLLKDSERNYKDISNYKNTFAKFEKNGKFGFINKIGREILPATYIEAENFSNEGTVKVKFEKNGNWVKINQYGRKVN